MTSRVEELVFIALGGHGEIGMNAALLGFGAGDDKRWIMIDCGVAFADETTPGVDALLPDIRFIEERADRLMGIVVTHGHLDHVGGLWRL